VEGALRVGGKRVAALVPWSWCPGSLAPRLSPGMVGGSLASSGWRRLVATEAARPLAQTRRNPPHNGSFQVFPRRACSRRLGGRAAGGVRALGLGLTACVLASSCVWRLASWRSGTLLPASCTSHPSYACARGVRLILARPACPFKHSCPVPIARRPPRVNHRLPLPMPHAHSTQAPRPRAL
jgi:hypothetical protein